MNEIFIKTNNNLEIIEKVLDYAKSNGYVLANDFEKEIPSAKKTLKHFKQYYPKNSKMIIHLFYNTLTGKNEMSLGSKTIYSSYPQFKSIKYYDNTAILNNLSDSVYSYQKCSCGAITLFKKDGSTISLYEKNLKNFYPEINLNNLIEKPFSQDCKLHQI